MKPLKIDLPDYTWIALKKRTAEEMVTLRYFIMEALREKATSTWSKTDGASATDNQANWANGYLPIPTHCAGKTCLHRLDECPAKAPSVIIDSNNIDCFINPV